MMKLRKVANRMINELSPYTQLRRRQEELKQEYDQVSKDLDSMLGKERLKIDRMCKRNGLYCGVVLTKEQLLQALELAMKTGENIRFPYKLYNDIKKEKQ